MALEIDIGPRIRPHRPGNRLTLKHLANKVGRTDAYFSQVENGRVSPFKASLKRIAGELQTKITDFFVESRERRTVVLGPGQRITLSLERWYAEIQSLVVNPKDKRMHPFLATIRPGGGSHGLYTHLDEEFGLVLKRELEIDLNGALHRVKKNESFYVYIQ